MGCEMLSRLVPGRKDVNLQDLAWDILIDNLYTSVGTSLVV
jgi:hypothetical protein